MILAIETSAEPASVSILQENGTFLTRVFPNNNNVNVPLADEIKSLLEASPAPISQILVGSGPGSYSGARVGLATAEAIAIVHSCPVATIPSFYGLDTPTEKVLIGDARRGAYFLQDHSMHTPKVYTKDEFSEVITATDPSSQFCSFEPTEKLPLPAHLIVQIVSASAEQLIRYWSSLTHSAQNQLNQQPNEVVYLRPPHITKAKSPF